MIKRVARLFVIKSRVEAYLVIYALAVGGVERGIHYLDQYPGRFGYLLFLACTGSVFMAGAKILDAVPRRARRRRPEDERRRSERRGGDRRQLSRERPA